MKNELSPHFPITSLSSLFIMLTIVTTAVALSGHGILLNETQIMYLSSTSAQVISAIYGLTLTGFIFVRNELSREEFRDDTLIDVVENLKSRYFWLLIFITSLVIVTLLLANLEISYEYSGEQRINTLIVNAGQSAFMSSLLAIAYFIFDIISPNRIERASKSLQNKLDPHNSESAKGNLEEFLRDFNEIERLLRQAASDYQQGAAFSDERRYSRRLSNARLVEILFRNERIDESLYGKLRELITLRNSIIHGADPVVSLEIVKAAAGALQNLRTALPTNLDGVDQFPGTTAT